MIDFQSVRCQLSSIKRSMEVWSLLPSDQHSLLLHKEIEATLVDMHHIRFPFPSCEESSFETYRLKQYYYNL